MSKAERRQSAILKAVEQEGFISTDELRLMFGVTPQTIRRDINELSKRDLVVRHHGGVARKSRQENSPYSKRVRVLPKTKRAIGKSVADRVEDGSSLFINIGTTTEAVAHALLARNDLRIATNDLHVAMILAANESFKISIAGGNIRKRDRGIVGHTATAFMEQYRMDYGIIGVSGISTDGSLLDFDAGETETAKAIMRNSERVLLVTDHTKFGRNAIVRYGSVEDVDELFTDNIPSEDFRKVIDAAGVKVRLVEGADDDETVAARAPATTGMADASLETH